MKRYSFNELTDYEQNAIILFKLSPDVFGQANNWGDHETNPLRAFVSSINGVIIVTSGIWLNVYCRWGKCETFIYTGR